MRYCGHYEILWTLENIMDTIRYHRHCRKYRGHWIRYCGHWIRYHGHYKILVFIYLQSSRKVLKR